CRDDRVQHARDDQHGRGRGQNATEPARVEAAEVDASVIEEIADEDARHEIAGQYEEDVDADERAVEPAQPGVERDNEVHGEGAQAVELRTVGETRLEPAPVAFGS